MKNNIDSKTKILGLIGYPIEHSISPQIHNTLCELLQVNGIYLPFEVNDLETVVQAFKALGVLGFNVTIPYKTKIIDFIDEISDEIKLIGSVNTVKNVNGKLIGYNTDGEGFLKALNESKVQVKGSNILVLGAGGSTRSICMKLALAGVKSIVILNRTPQKAKEIAELVNFSFSDIAKFGDLSSENLIIFSKDVNIIVNTTSVGMWPKIENSPIGDINIFENKPFVYDIIYNPAETLFLRKAKESSCKIENGLSMLVNQAVLSFEIWNDIVVSDDVRKNIRLELNV
jgi:shikimate dehydrogenase